MFINRLPRRKKNLIICNICSFPWCKYSHHGCFHTTSVTSLNMDLGNDAHNWLSWTCRIQLQHSTEIDGAGISHWGAEYKKSLNIYKWKWPYAIRQDCPYFIWIIQEAFEGLLTQHIAVKKYWNRSRRPRQQFEIYHWLIVKYLSKQHKFSGSLYWGGAGNCVCIYT